LTEFAHLKFEDTESRITKSQCNEWKIEDFQPSGSLWSPKKDLRATGSKN